MRVQRFGGHRLPIILPEHRGVVDQQVGRAVEMRDHIGHHLVRCTVSRKIGGKMLPA